MMTFNEFYGLVLNENSNTISHPFLVNKIFFKKGDIITKYGQVEEAVYFLNTGIVEMTIKSYVSEKVIDFFFDNQMFTSLTSFLNQLPSDVQMRALMDCEAEVISSRSIKSAYDTVFNANKFGRIILEQAYIKKAQREKDFLSKTAEERYAEMFRSHPQYISKIPVNKIAKYLGIHPESLSRIRKKLNS